MDTIKAGKKLPRLVAKCEHCDAEYEFDLKMVNITFCPQFKEDRPGSGVCDYYSHRCQVLCKNCFGPMPLDATQEEALGITSAYVRETLKMIIYQLSTGGQRMKSPLKKQ